MEEQKIRGLIRRALMEKEETEDVENLETENPEDAEIEAPEENFQDEGDHSDLQQNLESALEAAKQLGDEKLITQIGNTITYFTRSHIVKDRLAEIKRFQKLAGI